MRACRDPSAAFTSSSEPAARILSPATATAVAIGLSRSMVTIFLATKIVTGAVSKSSSGPSACAGPTASATKAPPAAAVAPRRNWRRDLKLSARKASANSGLQTMHTGTLPQTEPTLFGAAAESPRRLRRSTAPYQPNAALAGRVSVLRAIVAEDPGPCVRPARFPVIIEGTRRFRSPARHTPSGGFANRAAPSGNATASPESPRPIRRGRRSSGPRAARPRPCRDSSRPPQHRESGPQPPIRRPLTGSSNTGNSPPSQLFPLCPMRRPRRSQHVIDCFHPDPLSRGILNFS